MIRKWAVVAVLALAGCGSSHASTSGTTALPGVGSARKPSACGLLTAHDASQLAGTALTPIVGGIAAAGTCAYAASESSSTGAEITVVVDASAAAAHARFPTFVQPVAGAIPGLTLKAVPGLGDEASETRTAVATAIYFRHGAVLVRIDVHPAATDAALKAAATAALAHL